MSDRKQFTLQKDDILKLIENFDPNKVHGHDKISIRMVKLCNASLCKQLELIFISYLESGKFPLEWKKSKSSSCS